MTVNSFTEKITNIIDKLNKLGITELGSTATQAEKNVIIKLNNKLALDSFKKGLNEYFKSTIYAARPNTLQEASELAIELENENRSNNVSILHMRREPRYQRNNNNNTYNRNNTPHNDNYHNHTFNNNRFSNRNTNNRFERSNNYTNNRGNNNNESNRFNNGYNNINNLPNANNRGRYTNTYRNNNNRHIHTIQHEGNGIGQGYQDFPESQN